jgi:hypothetical protein
MKKNNQKGSGAIAVIVVILLIIVVAFLILGNKKDGASEEMPIDLYQTSDEEVVLEEPQLESELDGLAEATPEDLPEIENELDDFDLSNLDIDFEL